MLNCFMQLSRHRANGGSADQLSDEFYRSFSLVGLDFRQKRKIAERPRNEVAKTRQMLPDSGAIFSCQCRSDAGSLGRWMKGGPFRPCPHLQRWCPRPDLNRDKRFRKPLLYPIDLR